MVDANCVVRCEAAETLVQRSAVLHDAREWLQAIGQKLTAAALAAALVLGQAPVHADETTVLRYAVHTDATAESACLVAHGC